MIIRENDLDEALGCYILMQHTMGIHSCFLYDRELSASRYEDIIVWKKAIFTMDGDYDFPRWIWPPTAIEVIIKLKIPNYVPVIFTKSKCRAAGAVVMDFYPCEYGRQNCPLDINMAVSIFNHHFIYHKGDAVIPDSFDPNLDEICGHGIHFFKTFEEASDYDI